MRFDCFSKPLWALALCFCLIGGGFAAGVGVNNQDTTTAQAQEQDIKLIEQTQVLAFNFGDELSPKDVVTFDNFDLDEEVTSSLNISTQTSEVNLGTSLALFFDFDADEQAKPKPSRQPQNDNGDPWSEVSNFFKQYKMS